MFTIEQPEVTLAEITERLGVSKATAHRYATALRQAGLLRQSEGVFTLGPRIVELGSAALAGLGVIRVARPHLERLGGDTAQTAVLSVWDGEAPVVVRVHDGASAGRTVRVVVTTGAKLPPYSAQGLVFRAFLGEEDGKELEEVRRRRVVHVADVADEGIAAIAAPVFQGEEIVATMALVGTTPAISKSARGAMAKAVRDAAENLSLELGHIVEDPS